LPTRRSVLKGIADISATSFVRSLIPGLLTLSMTECCRPYAKLNVVLHGLFVMNVGKSTIQLLTPRVEEHKYLACNWDRKSIVCLLPNQKYELIGVEHRTQLPAFSRDSNIILSQSRMRFRVDPLQTYCEIVLPLPSEIRFLRGMKGPNLYKGKSAEVIQATGLSLCPVLTYRVCKELKLGDSGWKPKSYNGITNLHLFAEPETRMDPYHTSRAYKKLMCLLPHLDFEIAIDESPPLDLYTGIEGLLPEQEQGLSEWRSNGEGSHPTNCNTVMVTG
jgi:hypothetical protein